ncbi:zinc finger protein, putative [Plasmodium vinckei vinckei]|uniref:Zinc finger protein, putative n=1 Tax=Plasmodium vinckei vinckei TaxID=54757 RepID=A0A449BW24_PLAVN|nr:zinc finger protein, putative [Plasmodium vinckei vinckei]KEG03395.1 hypothetical protein YYE_01419 [Plasmodium vinckei vinckei]VEV57686.1 zinc finger protein, putative [Plasmodium vinckei vinckei]
MGRKKRKINIELKPFCYYCDREFDDEKVLIQHQKAKHFKCSQCNRKLDVASGLVVHMMQVHKTNLKTVPNSLPKRNDPELVIRGMEGVPAEIIEENLNKLKQKLGDKNIKRQQRVNWAQVTMAPTMEQFLQQAQMGNFYFPGFNSPHIPPTNNLMLNNNFDLKKNMPYMPMYPPGSNTNAPIIQPPPIGANMYPNMHTQMPSQHPIGYPGNLPSQNMNTSQKYPPNINFPTLPFLPKLPPNAFPSMDSTFMPQNISPPPLPPSAPPSGPPILPPSAPGMPPVPPHLVQNMANNSSGNNPEQTNGDKAEDTNPSKESPNNSSNNDNTNEDDKENE